MSDPIEIWVLYFTCGCIRWRDQFVANEDVQCEHEHARVHAIERKIVDRT